MLFESVGPSGSRSLLRVALAASVAITSLSALLLPSPGSASGSHTVELTI